MAQTSGLQNFDLALDDILDEAYSRVGGEHMTGRDSQVARRSLNLLFLDLINRDIPLSTLDEVAVTVTSAQSEYTCSSNIVDVLHTVLARSSVEIRMERISMYEFKDIPKKDQQGRPTQYTVDRTRNNVILKIWPAPENSTDIIKFWAATKIEDVTRQDQLIDLPTRFLPAIICGLAYYLSLKLKPDQDNLIQRLKTDYEEVLNRALEEDRERTNHSTVPYLRFV